MSDPRTTDEAVFKLNGIPSNPTPVASGSSTVDAGDLVYVVEQMGKLPRAVLAHLSLGSRHGSNPCGVCHALRESAGRFSDAEVEAANAILAWHGQDAIRCGVIYGLAVSLLNAGKISRSQGFLVLSPEMLDKAREAVAEVLVMYRQSLTGLRRKPTPNDYAYTDAVLSALRSLTGEGE